jgi:transposase InsO family protein
MPWGESSVKDQKVMFVADCVRGEESMTALCERYGISRQTGHELKKRFLAEGPSGLEERSRAPLQHGRATPAELVVRLIEARKRWPHWGPKKLLAKLSREAPGLAWPRASTVSEILRREGLSQPRRRRRRPLTVEQPFIDVTAANDAWCIDFKGWFRTDDGQRCDPFTVSDAFSRYLLAVEVMEPTGQAVQTKMDELFKQHGLPVAIRSDNGSPFASTGAGGLTRLSARWAKMGIRLERIWPGKPQQNGRHERMHGTLKPEACQPPAADAADQQERFDAFRAEFNLERPHEALGQRQPAEFYHSSPRPFVEPVGDPRYAAHEQVRRIRSTGEIRWRGSLLFVSEAITGEAVALSERPDGHWLMRFADVALGLIDRTSGRFVRFGAGRPPRSKASVRDQSSA